MATGASSPCGACKFLRRKCVADCIFAPHFCSEQGPARFAAVHKVFGASNVAKLLLHVPAPDRCEAVVTIAYEAHARIRDPVYGCVSHIFALQQQVACLQAQLKQVKAQLAQYLMESSRNNAENQWQNSSMISGVGSLQAQSHPYYTVSPQSFLDSIKQSQNGVININGIREIQSCRDIETVYCSKKRPPQTDLLFSWGEYFQVVNLQAQLASLKEQAAQCIISSSANPNSQKLYSESHSFPQDVQTWWQSHQNQGSNIPQFDVNCISNNIDNNTGYCTNGAMNPNPSMKYENSGFPDESKSFGSSDSLDHMQSSNSQWHFQDDLQSMAFRYIEHEN
ncbi:LOB domain-containing protein [Dorcoceras hygrometricum]|uniref:LOB domain-containing protein n=1 Tax=Dorcoceras hygrometricum TaxID=472368 RepID=A0A2Z7BEY0_9LAMI|nr:LOB domain-containing protein [Dorcoceras hygrometricum]